jgi:predicted nucleotidyltransferase
MVLLMQTPFGSHLYGLETPTSDRDYKGIFMPEARDILLGTIPKTQKLSSGPSHERNSQGDVDSETYSLHHFVQLALQGQTVALDMLHGNMETETSSEWRFLKKNRWRFYTRSIGQITVPQPVTQV